MLVLRQIIIKFCRHQVITFTSYCTKPLAAYPLIVSDEARLQVYHAACAAALATEVLVDLFTFFSPPAPYERLFVLTAPDAAPSQHTSVDSG